MIKYYPFFRIWGLPDASPFCTKMETWLRMAKVPYKTVSNPMNVRRAPKGKLPYIEHNGQAIGDSSLIIQHLTKAFDVKLDDHLSDEQRREALLVQRTLEEHLYWVLIFGRWVEDANWDITRNAFFKKAPFLIRGLIANKIRNKIKKSAMGHGMGLHDRETIYAMGIQDLEAVSAPLKNQPFILGERASSLDATAFGFFAQILYPPHETPLKTWFMERSWLVDYCNRMKKNWFPELEK